MEEKLKLHEMLYPLGLLDTINKMREDIAGKCDTVEGKGFSSNDFTDECLAATEGAVRFDTEQTLTDAQQKTALKNLGGGILSSNDFTDEYVTATDGAVRFDLSQSLSEEQKNTVLENIGALSAEKYSSDTAEIFSFTKEFKEKMSVWISVSDISPALLFGGTWERIEGRFILGVSDSYAVNKKGGSADASIVTHTHIFTNIYAGSGGVDPAGSYLQRGHEGINHSNAENSQTRSTISSSGSSGTGKNMPPYIALYIWNRVE